MRLLRSVGFCLAIAILGHSVALAQTGDQPPMPKPGPEHALLKDDVGTWDAVVEAQTAPGAPPMTSKGVEVNTLGCSGLCLITDFKGDIMPGVPFHGHGVTTWDPAKKKYVGSWTDSMATGLAIGESTYDAATKTFSGWMEGPDPTGKVNKMRSMVQMEGNRRVFTAYATGPDGKEMQVLKITYTRR